MNDLPPFDPQSLKEYMDMGGHGWIIPRPDGVKMLCGGPQICQNCKLEEAVFSTRNRIVVMEGFSIKPGDKILLLAQPDMSKETYEKVINHLRKAFPDTEFTIVVGFTGVQVAQT